MGGTKCETTIIGMVRKAVPSEDRFYDKAEVLKHREMFRKKLAVLDEEWKKINQEWFDDNDELVRECGGFLRRDLIRIASESLPTVGFRSACINMDKKGGDDEERGE